MVKSYSIKFPESQKTLLQYTISIALQFIVLFPIFILINYINDTKTEYGKEALHTIVIVMLVNFVFDLCRKIASIKLVVEDTND